MAKPKSKVTIVKTTDDKAARAAAKFGRADSDGTVWLIEGDSERVVGQFKVKQPKDALEFYVKRYLDLVDRLTLFENRIKVANVKKSEIDQAIEHFRSELENPSVVGNVQKLRDRLDKIEQDAEITKAEIDKNKAVNIQQTIENRIKIVNEAEKMVAKINDKINWKQTTEKFINLLNKWTHEQKTAPRIPKNIEDELWKKFAESRRVFEEKKKDFYQGLNKSSQLAKKAKEKIIEKAKILSETDKLEVGQEGFRNLIKDWKNAGRARRSVDDKLWEEFKGYMDTFYDKKGSADKALDEEYEKNYEAKIAILQEAKKLLPVKDPKIARSKYRAYMSRINDLGKVPSSKVKEFRAQIEEIDNAISDAEKQAWKNSDPRKAEINEKLLELKKKLEAK
ncbi:MAG: DUF349 domain-containing protein [Bifidobacteriaceae bacterium]|jgi:hypothetical protein|nr:DUF349 domain-containing protein [Bifidobacteriaceae bacterium]